MPQINNFADVRVALEPYIARGKQSGNYTLDRMQDLMVRLDNPQDKYKTIHIAGTSGKTSTSYYMAALLQAAGQKVGLTVSPHVDEINERVQIDLVPLPEKEFCSELKKFLTIVEKSDISPTYFELLVAFAYWEFARQKVDYAVVEVGMGGLLDGTNVIHQPDKICIITDIGFDHITVLGNTIEKITAQKAGIIQDHNPIFMYRQSPNVMDEVTARCRLMHASMHEVDPKDTKTFKLRNFKLAKNVFDYIAKNEGWHKLDATKVKSIQNLNIPARMEEFKIKDKTIIIDGSHNGQKMLALVQSLKSLYANKSAAVLVSFVSREAERAPEALAQLRYLTSKVIITSFAGEQDMPNVSYETIKIAELAREAGFSDIEIIEDPQAAFEKLIKQPEELLVVTGSFYLLNHIRPLILNS